MRLNALAAAVAAALIVPSVASAAFYTLSSVEVANPNAPAGTKSFALRVDDPTSTGADTLDIEGGILTVNLTTGLLKFQINSFGNPTPYQPFVDTSEGGAFSEANRRAPRGSYFSVPGATINAYDAPGGVKNEPAFRPAFSAGLSGLQAVSLGSALGLPSGDPAFADGFTLGVLVVQPGSTGAIVGNGTVELKGPDVSNTEPLAFTIGGVVEPTNVAPVVVNPAPQTVTFGQVTSNGAAFSVTVDATDANASDILNLVLGTLPAGVTAQVSPLTGGTSPETFTVSGTVQYNTNNSQVTIPFSVSDNAGGSTPGAIVLNVVPEPTSLLALAGAAGIGMIRRRK